MQYLPDVVTLATDSARCVGCGRCLEVCPREVLALDRDRRVTLRSKDNCIECGACARNCPAQAISVTVGTGCALLLMTGSCCGPGDGDGAPCCGPSAPATSGPLETGAPVCACTQPAAKNR